MLRYTTVLFDLDGTLLDSIRLILECYRHTFAVHGMPARPEEELLRGIGTPLRAQLAACSDDPRVVESMVATYRAWNHDKHDSSVAPYAGVVGCVRALDRAGVRLGIVTSKARPGALQGLSLMGLSALFPVLVCGEDVTNAKPHREPVDRALFLLNARSDEALFVGDSLHDMHAGRSAEVETGAALWGPFTREELSPSEPTHWLESPEDILALVLG
jgi:pyrophosphatase PpaX